MMLPILLTLIPGMIGYNVRDELGSWGWTRNESGRSTD
jgi:hypothetical protein